MEKENIIKKKKTYKLQNKHIKCITFGLFLTGLVLMSVGIIHSLYYKQIAFSCTETHFIFESSDEFEEDEDKIKIDSVLWEPKDEFDVYEKRPALVYLHGFSADKMQFKTMAHEMGRRGIVGLSVSGRGHGGTSGGARFTYVEEVLSAVKWLRDNADDYDIDKNRIGVVGSSMGAYSVTVAAIFDFEFDNHWIDTTIVMDGPAYNTATGGSDEGGGFVKLVLKTGDWIYPTVDHDYEEDAELIGLKNNQPDNHTIVPRNYLYVVGENDVLYSANSARRTLWHYGQEETYGTSDYKKVKLNRKYGSYGDGSARKIAYIDGVGHGGVGGNANALEEMIKWVEKSFSLTDKSDFPGDVEIDAEWIRYSGEGWNIALLGILFIFIPSTIYLGNYARNKKVESKAAKEIEGKDLAKLLSLYSAVFIGTSALVIPVIKLFNLVNIIVVDFLVFNLLVLSMLMHAILLLPFIILFMFLERKHFDENLKDFGLDTDYQSYLKNLLFGVSIFLIIYIPLLISGYIVDWLIHPVKLLGFLEAFGYLLIAGIVYSLFFRGLIQTKLSRYEKDKLIMVPSVREITYAAGITAIFSATATCIILYMFSIEIDDNFLMPNVEMFFLLIMVFFLLGCVSGWLYRKTRNILGPAVLYVLLISLIVATRLPAI